MGGVESKPLESNSEETKSTVQRNASGKKICCACPDTKRARDECVVRNGEEQCEAAIEAHKKCLRSEGFDV